MGERRVSSGVSKRGKKYGSEYTTLLTNGNIKFVRYNNSLSAKSPMESMTKGRVYVVINSDNKLSSISYYDEIGKRKKQIDLLKGHKSMKPHVHHGYEHNENDNIKWATRLTSEEKKMVANVNKLWYNYRKQKTVV